MVFDIESDYQALASYLEALESLNTESFPVYVCIPFWLEDDVKAGGKNTVERIIKAIDGVFVMNYYRDDEKKQMDTEYSLAQKYGKAI